MAISSAAICTVDAQGYTIAGVRYTRVSELISTRKPQRCRAARSPEEANRWALSRDLGIEMHRQIACYWDAWAAGDADPQKPADVAGQRVLGRFMTMGLVYVAHEATLYDTTSGIAGTADLVARNADDGTYAIIDWKRTKFPLYEAAYTGYVAQLNLYRALFMKMYPDRVVASLMLIVANDASPDTNVVAVPVLDLGLLPAGGVRCPDLQWLETNGSITEPAVPPSTDGGVTVQPDLSRQ